MSIKENESFEKYEVRKTVRFNLFWKNDTLENIVKLGLKKDNKIDHKYKLLSEFLEKYSKFININNELFFSDWKEYFRNKLSINYKFLDIHLKQEFYNSKQRTEWTKNIKIIDKKFNFLRKFLIDNFNENIKIFEQLKGYSLKLESEKSRFSEINFILQNLNSKYIYVFKNLYENLKQTNEKYLDDKIDKQKAEIIQISQDILVLLWEFWINNWIEIAKWSFNYFTLNKSSKIYFEDEVKKYEYNLNRKYYNIPKIFKLGYNFYEDFWINKNDLENKNIKEIYDFLKEFKATKKSKFLELIIKYDYDEIFILENNLDLFNDLNEYDFINLKKNIISLKKLNDELQELVDIKKLDINDEKVVNKKKEIWNISKIIWNYFDIFKWKIYFFKYKKICNFYKNIAVDYWEIKAKLAWFEKQKIEAEKLRYFWVIIEKYNSKYLWLIPKEENKHKNAYELLKSKNDENWEIKVYYFESLTLRALQKLCFKEEKNTFMRDENNNVENELREKFNYKKIKRFDEFKINWKIDEIWLIEFYKDVLQTESAKKMLSLDKFNFNKTDILWDFENLQEFEIELEKYAYKKVCVWFSKEEFEEFISKHEVLEYEISSQDIRLNRENKEKNKAHTNYWLDFWSESNSEIKYNTRINPEFSIYFRVWSENLKDKKDKWLLPEPKKLDSYKNRFIKDKLTFVSNINLNSNDKSINLSYKIDDDLNKIITNFNNDIENKLDIQNTWHFWIDRWLNELATLSIVKFLDNDWKNFEFWKQKIYRLKDEYSKIVDIKINQKTWNLDYEFKTKEYSNNWHTRIFQPAKNLSYFINDDIFDIVEVWSIDLTQAKLFWDKIVENADIMTHLRLKELAAKRTIFDLYSNWKISKTDKVEIWWSWTLKIKNPQIESKTIYWWITDIKDNDKFKNIIIDHLNKYLQSINLSIWKDITTIVKINHLRDSLASNLVWILLYLYKKYWENWKIVFENTDKKLNGYDFKIIENHFLQSNEFVERRYELAIYNKFQQIWIVPPNLTKSVLLKDLYDINKFWLVNFIHTWKTSSICPVCLENYWNKDNLKKHLFKNNWECFSKLPKELQEDTECDKIAAFTVAKFWYKNIFSENDTEKNYNKTQTIWIEFKCSK